MRSLSAPAHPAPSRAGTAPEHAGDAAITAAVELLLLRKGVCTHLREVASREGIVELVGFTDSLQSRERAVAMAKTVRGVRGVINKISIRTLEVPDADLGQQAEQALRQDPLVRGFALRCRARAGVLTVAGTVPSGAEVPLVLRVLHGLPGVRRLNNQLRTNAGAAAQPDAEIAARVCAFLAWGTRGRAPLVHCHASHGVVHLSGTVATATEHEQVVATAYLAGATRVDARGLRVAYWALDGEPRRQQFAAQADEDVAQAIRDVLARDPRLAAGAPRVHMRDGVVTLHGTVKSLKARQAAEQDAANVVGVWHVRNQLLVQVHRHPPDATLHQRVQETLADDAWVGHYRFGVSVCKGRVQLAGTVDSQLDRERVADLIAGLEGVAMLDNQVAVFAHRGEWLGPVAAGAAPASAGQPTDQLLAERLRDHYHWSARLHDQAITIRVSEGHVTLTGTVDTWLDRKLAAAGAYDCGARQVTNYLVLPDPNAPDTPPLRPSSPSAGRAPA